MKTLLTFLVGCLLAGCCTFERCADKYGSTVIQDSVTVDTIFFVQSLRPKDSLQFSIQIDSFLMLRPVDTLVFEKDRVKASIYKDQFNNYLQADIECLPDTIEVPVPVRLDLPCPPSVMLGDKPDPWWKIWWHRIASAITAIVIVRFLVIRIFKI